MIRTILKPLSFVPALLLMYMIFSFSAQPGEVSSQVSYKVSYKIVEAADYIFDAGLEEWQIGEWAGKINFITRKLAHMTEYFALAVAVSFPLYVYGLHGILLMLVAGLICVGFACGDEYHQAFVAGRGPSVKDVCIDSVGVFFGIIFVRIIGWTGRKTIFKPKEKKKNPKGKKMRNKKGKYYEDDYYEDDYRNAPYPPPPYRADSRYQEPPYRADGRYREIPYERENGRYTPEDDWFDEEDIDIDSAPDASYDAGWEDPSRADDWGMEQPSVPDRTPRKEPPITEQPPRRRPEPHPKKRKKEKDWFFDM